MKRIAATTAIVSLLGAPAFAGALIFEPPPEPVVTVAPPPPPPPVLPVWTGAYAGGQLGWGWGEADGDVDGVAFDESDSGLIGGLHAGYDFQFGGGFVLGGEVAYDRTGISPSAEGVSVDIDNIVRLTARAGFGFGNGLVYAKGGATWMDGDVTIAGTTTGASDWGWVAGGGYEHRFTPNVTGGVEGLFHRVTGYEGFDVDLWTVQARVSYRF